MTEPAYPLAVLALQRWSASRAVMRGHGVYAPEPYNIDVFMQAATAGEGTPLVLHFVQMLQAAEQAR